MTGLKELHARGSSLQGLPAGIGKQTQLQKLDDFWVLGSHEGSSSSSSSSSSNICELRNLNHLHGSLIIHNLDMVASGEEAASAQLHNKNSLTSSLSLKWKFFSREWAKEQTTSEEVLEALRPCPTLHELKIQRYPGCKVPTWLGDSTTLMLSGLQKLRLQRWDGCTNLPALGNLPKLRRLQIWDMPKVRRVGAEWFGSNHGFPKLEYLQFGGMVEWEEWDNSLVEELFFTFPCLSQLEISYCPKLRSLPPIFSTSSLQGIDVFQCSNLSNWLGILPASIDTLGSISAEWVNGLPSLPNLKHLTIRGDDGVSDLSNHLVKLSALKKLNIEGCPNLESLPQEMASLEQLQTLQIYNCRKLRSLPSLPNLEQLTIGGYDGRSELSHDLANKLGTLKRLEIQNCPNLESLPQEMASLKQLQILKIYNCGKLRSLPSLPNLEELTIGKDGGLSELSNNLVNKLGALKMLSISNCPNLESLPQEMASLKQLQKLLINFCPKLKESCNKEGAQWCKIQHIPYIMIDYQDVRRNARV